MIMMIKENQLELIFDLLRMRSENIKNAVKLVLFDGISQSKAAAMKNCTEGNLSRALLKINKVHESIIKNYLV